MRLLILGAGGRLGRLLRAAWPEKSDVTPIWHGGPDTALQFDILTQPELLRPAVAGTDGVLVLAGVTKEKVGRPFSDNAAIAKAVLDCGAESPVFLVSTAAVYGTASGVLAEDHLLQPVSDYGRSKQAMETVATDSTRAVVLRIGNVAGADALLGVPRSRYRLDQFAGGGFPVRSYIGPRLLAHTFADLAQKAAMGEHLPKVLNISCPKPVSMALLLDAAGLEWDAVPASGAAIETVHLDTSKLWGTSPPDCDAASIVADWRSTVSRQ